MPSIDRKTPPSSSPEAALFVPVDIDAELRLEPFDQTHAEAILEIVQSNRDRLREWMAWAPAIQSIDDVRAFITDSQQRRAQPGGSGEWVILLDGVPVGVVGCTALEWQDKRTSIGAWLGIQAQGRGVAKRALGALINRLFEAGIHRIEAFHAVGNNRSDAMLQRLGFTKEGVLRGHEWLHDTPVDDVVMSLLATDPRPDRP